jgi:hypothetical protein
LELGASKSIFIIFFEHIVNCFFQNLLSLIGQYLKNRIFFILEQLSAQLDDSIPKIKSMESSGAIFKVSLKMFYLQGVCYNYKVEYLSRSGESPELSFFLNSTSNAKKKSHAKFFCKRSTLIFRAIFP